MNNRRAYLVSAVSSVSTDCARSAYLESRTMLILGSSPGNTKHTCTSWRLFARELSKAFVVQVIGAFTGYLVQRHSQHSNLLGLGAQSWMVLSSIFQLHHWSVTADLYRLLFFCRRHLGFKHVDFMTCQSNNLFLIPQDQYSNTWQQIACMQVKVTSRNRHVKGLVVAKLSKTESMCLEVACKA